MTLAPSPPVIPARKSAAGPSNAPYEFSGSACRKKGFTRQLFVIKPGLFLSSPGLSILARI
jgi:hypothetical protein